MKNIWKMNSYLAKVLTQQQRQKTFSKVDRFFEKRVYWLYIDFLRNESIGYTVYTKCQLTPLFCRPSPILLKFGMFVGLNEKMSHTKFQVSKSNSF